MDDITLFSMERPRFHFSNRDVETELKRFSLAFDVKDRTSANFRKWKNKSISLDTVNRMFGSFSRACTTFGIACGGKKVRYSDDELLEFYEALWRWRGHRPALGDFEKFRKASGRAIHYDVFRRRYGPYVRFQQLFADYKQGLLDKKTLLCEAKPRKRRVAISLKIRHAVFRRDDRRCVDCGRTPPEVQLEVDHRLPVSKGGTNELDNLCTRCRECNKGKGDRDDCFELVPMITSQNVAIALERIHSLMTQYALTPADIEVKGRRGPTRKKGRVAAKTAIAPKYHDPKTGAKWSGRGREPLWIKGKKREKFLIPSEHIGASRERGDTDRRTGS